MPTSDYIKVHIGDLEVQVEDPKELPISINYSLEDAVDFTKKTSSNSLALSIPATLANDKASNTFRNMDVQDLTAGEVFRRNLKCTIESNGNELLNGKAFLTSGSHTDRPLKYEFDLYGDNADWLIDLRESTIYDFIKHLSFSFTREEIISSWGFSGRNEAKPYVFAPIRYRQPFEDAPANLVMINPPVIKDFNIIPEYMKPSLSVYYILYWGFKSVGYRIQSKFCDFTYFRRMVMPWTWGSFLSSEGTNLDIHNFLAKSTEKNYTWNSFDGYIDLKVSNDATDGAYDNNDDYTYNAIEKRMEWTYKTNQNFGPLIAGLSITLDVDNRAGWNSDVELRLEWSRVDLNGIEHDKETHIISSVNSPALANVQEVGIKEDFYKVQVQPGEKIYCKAWVHIFESKTGNGAIDTEVLEFKLDYLKVPLGGTINFANFSGFKKHKFLDFVKGLVGLFNWSFNTDSVNKVVYIEPTHRYSLNHNFLPVATTPGFFNEDFISWQGKEDLSKEWRMELFREYEKEVRFVFKDDGNDGILKKVQDRHLNTLGAGKYVFPDRFKKGDKEIPNEFFSPLMHYDVEQWKSITGEAPQIPVMVPENISNTSASEADNTFAPKIAYYKGNVSGFGGWRFDGETFLTLPFLFAVNYKVDGHKDPILSFSDEKIKSANGFVIGRGLLKRFYWQRLAIMRNGQWYNTWFNLRNGDVSNQLHREHKIYNGHKWELVNIKDFKPLQEGSTSCLLRRWAPIEKTDSDNTFPSEDSILNAGNSDPNDIKYNELKALATDIPTE